MSPILYDTEQTAKNPRVSGFTDYINDLDTLYDSKSNNKKRLEDLAGLQNRGSNSILEDYCLAQNVNTRCNRRNIARDSNWIYFSGTSCSTSDTITITYTSSTSVTSDSTSWVKWSPDWAAIPQKTLTPAEKIREIIQKRKAPAIIHREGRNAFCPDRNPIPHTTDIREIRARETLHRVVGNEEYKRFMIHGFVSVQNRASGRVYQIYPGNGVVFVYEKGIMIERLCVHLPREYAPTDGVIIRFLMAINNEDKLWSMANKHGTIKKHTASIVEVDRRPLVEIFGELKERAVA